MGYLKWVDSKVKHLRWFDISLIKLSTAAFVLLVAKFYPPILSLEWYWYVVLGLVAAIRPIMAMFRK